MEDLDKFEPEKASHSDIWPEFLDDKGYTIKRDALLIGTYNAKMHIVFPEMAPKHLSRLKASMEFLCMEGKMHIAVGKVTSFEVN